jgi:hypothetical protein
MGSDRASH